MNCLLVSCLTVGFLHSRNYARNLNFSTSCKPHSNAMRRIYHYQSWSFLLRLLKGPLHPATLGKVSRDQLGTKKEKHFPSLSTWTVPLLSPSPPSLSLLLGLPSFPLFLSLHSFPFLFILLAGKSVWAIMPFRNTKVAKLIPMLTSLLSTVGFLLIV